MTEFISWAILGEYTTLVTMVYIIIEFTKELPFIKKMPTKYWSAIISFLLISLTNLHSGGFQYWDIVLYILSAISISLGSNGLANFNVNKLKQ